MGIWLLSASQMNETWKPLKDSVIFSSFPNSLETLKGIKLFYVCLRDAAFTPAPSPTAPPLKQFGRLFVWHSIKIKAKLITAG